MNFVIKEIVNDKIAKLILNRPNVLNSFNSSMAIELQEYLKECQNDDNIRAIVITGMGRAFCAGQDLAEVTENKDLKIEDIVRNSYNPTIRLIRNIEKPVIAYVNGVAAGAGANIALACDIVIASENASFIQSFANIGLIPDSAGTFFLPKLVGMARATALMFTAEKVSAKSAVEMGMIFKSFTVEECENQVLELANKLANMPTKGFGLTKRAMNLSLTNNLDQQLDLEENLQAEAANSYDYKEGVAAFLEKRKAEFIGK